MPHFSWQQLPPHLEMNLQIVSSVQLHQLVSTLKRKLNKLII